MLSINAGAALAKQLFPLVGAAGATALRLGIAACMLAGVFRVWRVRLDRRLLRAAIPYGLSLGGMNLLFYASIQRTPLGIAMAVEFTGPLVVAAVSTQRRADFGWIALAVLGLLLLLPLGAGVSSVDPAGIALALGAVVCWGAYILTGKRAGDALGAQAPACGMIVAALLVLPFGVAEAGGALLDPRILGLACGVALLSSALPYSLEMYALRRLPTQTFGILISGEPVLGAVFGTVFLGEVLLPAKWTGIAAIVAAAVGTSWTGRSEPTN